MARYVYVDNSNVWIEGMRVSAVENGLAFDIYDAIDRNVTDRWSYDFGKLLGIVGGQRNRLRKAVLFGSRPPQNDSLWEAARQGGFEVVVEDRNAQNREKKIDSGIAVRMVEDSYELIDKENDEMILVAGDRDYVPALLSIGRRGIRAIVYFWDHAAQELKDAAAEFVSLNPLYAQLKR